VNDATPNAHRDGFARVYRDAFAEEPYEENYTFEEVIDTVWHPHRQDGIIALALDTSEVVGLGCALPLEKSPEDVQAFLAQRRQDGMFPVDPATCWYMSELAVRESYRRRGIGLNLVRQRLQEIVRRGDKHYVFRTASEKSKSIGLYQRLGSTEIPVLQDVSASDQVQVNGSESTARVFLYGSCEAALEKSLA